MVETLEKYLIERLGNNTDGLSTVLSKFKEIRVQRKKNLLLQGEVCKYVYFVVEGCLQYYVYDADMNEITRDIIIENQWCSDLVSFGNATPSTENIRAVEPSILLGIDQYSFRQMMEQVPQFTMIYNQILSDLYSGSVARMNTMLALSASERIKWLMEYRPELATRISSKLIASYLGINKDVYSRLKSKS